MPQPSGLDSFAPQAAAPNTLDVDALQKAINSIQLAPGALMPDSNKPDAPSSPVEKNKLTLINDKPTGLPYDANDSRNRLAQDAFLTNPAEMRKVFPVVLKDASLNHTDHLDFREIQIGLESVKLTDNEHNFLAALKRSYDALSIKGDGSIDSGGVSETGLAMVDKAVNRKLDEDPAWTFKANLDVGKGIEWGIVGGLTTTKGDWKAKAMAAGGIAAGMIILYEGLDYYEHRSDGYKDVYDKVQKNYLPFEKPAEAVKASGAVNAQGPIK